MKHYRIIRSGLLALALFSASWAGAQARYVFYFIGDGMGTNQVLSAEMYRAELAGKIGRKQLQMTTFPYSGQVATFSASNGITDSSAAGTCLATGTKTNNGMLGLSPSGDTLRTVAEILRDRGYGIGIMTTVAIDHATPAAFYAKVPERHMYYEIGTQLANTGFDFFGGAGFHRPQSKDNPQAPNLYDLAEQAGYTIAHGYDDAQTKRNSRKLILTQAGDGIDRTKKADCLPYAIDRTADALTLPQIVSTAIPFLDSRYDRFFMMVEGGMIDYACHGQDGAASVGETLDMDSALVLAYRFYLAHPDETLIVVTADHETGGMALGNSDYTLHLELLQHQHCSAWVLSDLLSGLFRNGTPGWDKVKSLLADKLGFYREVEITAEEDASLRALYDKAVAHRQSELKTLYKTMNELGGAAIALLNKKAKLGWTSYAHTAHAVPVFAVGVGAERFTGWHDNTEIAPLILQAATDPSADKH